MFNKSWKQIKSEKPIILKQVFYNGNVTPPKSLKQILNKVIFSKKEITYTEYISTKNGLYIIIWFIACLFWVTLILFYNAR